ncbi:unnamed protein product [Ilex paraguariensis]|uniref:Uncharacterized protein n=1 Tax=Ilex paraguariensis TaxID=185542 RepID=A0ABC8SBG3_9AQUA
MARILVLEGIAVGGGGVNNGDRLFNHLSVGILLLCQVLIAMAIISVMLFGCADCADDQTGARKARKARGWAWAWAWACGWLWGWGWLWEWRWLWGWGWEWGWLWEWRWLRSRHHHHRCQVFSDVSGDCGGYGVD